MYFFKSQPGGGGSPNLFTLTPNLIFVCYLKPPAKGPGGPHGLALKGLFINYVIPLGGAGGYLKRLHKMTEGGGRVIQKMTDDNDSSFSRNGVQYILIKGIDLFNNPFNIRILFF